MAVQFVLPRQQIVDANGDPVSGARVTFFEPATTNPKDVYSDEALSIPTSQPVIADAAGMLPRLYMNGKYKVTVKDADDVLIFTEDNCDFGLSSAIGISEALPIEAGGTNATTPAAARNQLGAASQSQVSSIASNVTQQGNLLDTGLHSDGDRFGTLATLDDITGSSEFTSDGWKATNPFATQLLHVRDQKTAGTNGGTFTSGSWQTRTINTSVTNEITGASISSNQIVLPEGAYYIEATASGQQVGLHKAKLRNVSDSTDILIGTTEYAGVPSGDSDDPSTRSIIRGRFTLNAQKNLEIQHRCASTVNNTGFGEASNFGVVEVYTEVLIWKVG